ncbi:putative Chlorophyllase-1 [Corchorus olitorius]|uniref:Chlorophyllase-1 n=1 Tax=Corchorus olitorius TaxID=93759 RepID=A0A1R3KT99_9ROSI|nr:putative Chlorophyllase-1 [Corchorus olitorius]
MQEFKRHLRHLLARTALRIHKVAEEKNQSIEGERSKTPKFGADPTVESPGSEHQELGSLWKSPKGRSSWSEQAHLECLNEITSDDILGDLEFVSCRDSQLKFSEEGRVTRGERRVRLVKRKTQRKKEAFKKGAG